MKIPYQIILPAVPLLGNLTNQQYPQVKDYRQLAREYGEQIARVHGTSLDWIDFDASQSHTRQYCRQVIGKSPKECKITMYSRNFELGEVKDSWPSQQTVYHQEWINGGSSSDKVTISEEVTYKDIYKTTTTNAFHLGTNIKAEGEVNLVFEKERVSVGIDFDWDTSSTSSEAHELIRKKTFTQEISLDPHSKTKFTLLLREGNYDVDFNADIIIDGYFVYAFGRNVEINPGDGRWGAYWFVEDAALIQVARRKGSPYVRKLADGYYYTQNDNGIVASYEVKGELKGVNGYKIDGKKEVTPISQANTLQVNKYYPAGVSLLAAAVLFFGR